jgi:hypothetical protein
MVAPRAIVHQRFACRAPRKRAKESGALVIGIVEVGVVVRTIAKRFVLRVATPAEGVMLE